MTTDIKQIESLYRTLQDLALHYGLQFLVAVVLLVVGLWIGGRVARSVEAMLILRKVDVTLARFLANFSKGIVAVLVAVLVLSQMGIAIAPLIAALGAVAFGASFAVQGLLANFGAGIAIIVTRPYLVGDTIETRGVAGVVKGIHLGKTILETEDGEEVSIPNHMILGQVLVNSGAVRLADEVFGVAYGTDITMVVELLHGVLKEVPLVAVAPRPKIGLDKLGASSLDIRVRYWVPTQQYFSVRFECMQKMYEALVKAGVQIPYPHQVLVPGKPQI